MKSLPIAMAGVHAAACIVVFGLAIRDPERSGLLPVLLYFSDYPASVLMETVRRALHFDLRPEGRLLVDGVVYVTFGSGWYYLLGWLLRAGVRRIEMFRDAR